MSGEAVSGSETPSSDIRDYLRRHKETVEAYLERFLPSSETYPEIIHEAMRYSIFAGGKRIRPILTLATGEALGADFERLIHLACALEMIHTYSLIHDDLPAMDDDDFRRGLPTSHRNFGEGIAILAGDGLLTLAVQLLAEIPGTSEIADRKVGVLHRVCRAIGTRNGMIAGQVVDLATQGQEYSEEQLQFIHSSKTGALIEASVVCAGILAGASEETLSRLGKFGAGVGLAFQIVDDILDVEGDPEEMGKATGKDDQGKKATYPAKYGLDRSRLITRRLIEDAIQEIAFLGSRGETLRELARFISVRRF